MPDRPNLVFLIADSFRADVLGHLGNSARVTPHLDQLVENGAVSFRNAFAQSPVCTPSRCSFMTGHYPHVHGHRSMRNLLKPWEPNLLSVLMEAGYHLWWGGKNDLLRMDSLKDSSSLTRFRGRKTNEEKAKYFYPKMEKTDPFHAMNFQGLLKAKGEGLRYRDWDDEMVEGVMEHINSSARNQPVCYFLNFHQPHPPYWAKPECYDRVRAESLPGRLPQGDGEPTILKALRARYGCGDLEEETWQEIRRQYYAMCLEVDNWVGAVIEALKARGIYENTWICFFSDHGDFAGDYGLVEKTHCTLQDALVRVPLVVKPPGSDSALAGIRDGLVELIDLPSTLYEGLGLDPGYTPQGISLGPLMKNTGDSGKDAVFAEVGARPGEKAFINREVENLSPDQFYARQSSAAIPAHMEGSYAVMCRTKQTKIIRRPYTREHEFYDLEKDPGETRNLHGHPGVKMEEDQMGRRLLDFFLTTGDVLPHQSDSREG